MDDDIYNIHHFISSPDKVFVVLELKLCVMGEWIPKVGDRVVITKSKENWAPNMDVFIGQIRTIKSYNDHAGVSFELYEDESEDDENSINDWFWSHTHGHFIKAPYQTKRLVLKLKINGNTI